VPSACFRNRGFQQFRQYPLIDAIFRRRTRRISAGIKTVRAGTLSFESPEAEPQPLTELEETILIAVTGCTGLTIPDRPFESVDGSEKIMGSPHLSMAGRSAGSPVNAQATHLLPRLEPAALQPARHDDSDALRGHDATVHQRHHQLHDSTVSG
jgi:hypothetical protein